MRIKWIRVAAFLMVFQGAYTGEQHDHVHDELPRWEILNEAAVRTSGDPSSGVSTYYWGDGS